MGFFSSSQNSPKPGSLADSLQPYLLQRDKLLANNVSQQDIILAKYKQKLRLETLTKSLLSLKNPSKQDIQQWALKANVSPTEWSSLAPIIKEIEVPKAKSNKEELEKAQQKQRNKALAKSLLSLKNPSKQDIQQWALKANVSPTEWNSLTSIMNTIIKPKDVKSKTDSNTDKVPAWTKTVQDYVKLVTKRSSDEAQAQAQAFRTLYPKMVNRVYAIASRQNIPPAQAVNAAFSEYNTELDNKAVVQKLIPKNDNSWFGSGNYNAAQDAVVKLSKQGIPIQTLGEELEKKGWTDSQVKEFLDTAMNFKTPKEAGLDPKKLARTTVPEGGHFEDSNGNVWVRKGDFLVNIINGWKVRYGR